MVRNDSGFFLKYQRSAHQGLSVIRRPPLVCSSWEQHLCQAPVSGYRLIEVPGGVDETYVAEGLGEVAQKLTGIRVNHLREEAQVVGLLCKASAVLDPFGGLKKDINTTRIYLRLSDEDVKREV